MSALAATAVFVDEETALSCACHGQVMLWHRASERPAGGRWECAVKNKERAVERRLAQLDDYRARDRRYNDLHPGLRRAGRLSRVKRNRAVVADELAARGGTCVHTGCTRTDIEWHHRDPATKVKKIAVMMLASVAKLRTELAKCDPLCEPHHHEAHRELAA